MRNWKRLISVVLALVLVSTMFTGLALAADELTPVNVPFEKIEIDKDEKEQEFMADTGSYSLYWYVDWEYKDVKIDPAKEKPVYDTFDWNSSDTAVGYVNTNGQFTPKKAGKTTVTVSSHMDKKVNDTFTITVKAQPVVTGITFNDSSFEVAAGKGLNFAQFAKLLPEDEGFNPNNYTPTAKSSDPEIVTASGWNVTGVKAGTATVTFTITNNDGSSASATATITVTENALTGLSFSKSSITINKAEKTTVELSSYLTTTPTNATKPNLKWESSNEQVAKVDQSTGVVSVSGYDTGRPGTTTITVKSVKYPEISASIEVTVVESEAITEVKFDENTIVLYYVEKVGKLFDASNEQYVYLNIQPAAAAKTIKTVSWRTSNAKVAIPQDGDADGVKVVAVGKGRCTITCTFKDTSGKVYSASFKVKVTDKSPTAKLNKKAVTLKVKKSFKLSAKDADKGTTLKGTWKSSDKKVAKVNSKGKVTGVNPGRAIITFTPKNKTMNKVTCVVWLPCNPSLPRSP